MLRPLLINDEVKAKAAAIRAYAMAHPFDLDTVRKCAQEQVSPLDQEGVDPTRFCMEIFCGFWVAFTIEQHPGGWAKHISVSVVSTDPKRMPNPISVTEIMGMFGMKGQPGDGTTTYYTEGGDHPALNVIEKMEDHEYAQIGKVHVGG